MNVKAFIEETLDVLMGFRKFIAFMAIFVVSVIFRCKGLIESSQFTDIMKNTFTLFCGSNSIEHFTSMVKDHIASKIAIVTGGSNATDSTNTTNSNS